MPRRKKNAKRVGKKQMSKQKRKKLPPLKFVQNATMHPRDPNEPGD